MADLEQDADSQDLAEVFDETNTTADGYDIAHPDVAPDVYDVTRAEDDDDEDEPADPDRFDPDDIEEGERERMLEEDDGIDETGVTAPGDADLVSGEDDSTTDYEAEGPSATARSIREDSLDSALEASFPASDPVAIASGAD